MMSWLILINEEKTKIPFLTFSELEMTGNTIRVIIQRKMSK